MSKNLQKSANFLGFELEFSVISLSFEGFFALSFFYKCPNKKPGLFIPAKYIYLHQIKNKQKDVA